MFPLAKFVIENVYSIPPQNTHLYHFATMGDETKNRTNPFCAMQPKEAKASMGGNIIDIFANKLLWLI